MAKIHLESEKLSLIKEGKMSESGNVESHGKHFDILNDLRLVPKFDEKDVDVFFTLFERIADTRGWTGPDRAVLLQCVLVGRAQEAFSMLSSSDCENYATVKATILKTYELVPEAYRQKFRNWKMGEKTHVEFARDLSTHFSRWCAASDVRTFEDLCSLMILEQFKCSVSENVALYINEQKVTSVSKAAVLADDFVLTHKVSADLYAVGATQDLSVTKKPVVFSRRSVSSYSDLGGSGGARELEDTCNFCHRKGHWKKDCWVLKSKKKTDSRVKPAACAAPAPNLKASNTSGIDLSITEKLDLSSYTPFLTKGYVSLVGSKANIPVT
ncbi:uncharacterized protein LOC106511236, partial [Austrofundulus limnaeus]|uniref:Uncharacterized protein LOC106511236 n=1 Tax=Austrofundulus limnaeus TaxID=52670 RepID=A0A2I4AIY0_AUSLI